MLSDIFRRLCRALPLLATFMISPVAAAEPIIDLFSSRAEIELDGGLVVAETITASVPGGGHGMFRDIPYIVRLANGRTVVELPEIMAVNMDGKALSIDDVERRDGGLFRVYMRDVSKTLTPGQHTFSLRYRMRNMIGFFDDHDELNWNVTGALWSVPIKRAVYALTLPEGALVDHTAAWLGQDGSHDGRVSQKSKAEVGRSVAVFQSQQAIPPGEGMTCAVTWQKGIVVPPASDTIPAGLLPATLLVLIAWGYFIQVWRRFGRDPTNGTIIALFDAPIAPASSGLPPGSAMSPAAINYLMNRTKFDSRGLAAAIVSLAGRRACHLSGDQEQGFFAAIADGSSPHPEELAIQQELRRGGPLTLGKSDGERLANLRDAVAGQLAAVYPDIWRFNVGWSAGGILLILVGVFGCMASLFGPPDGWPDEVQQIIALAGMLALCLMLLIGLVGVGLASGGMSWFKGLFIGLILIAMAGGTTLGLVALLPGFLEIVPASTAVMLALALLAPLPFLPIMKAPTREARRLMDGCDGLALYIGTAETDRFRHLNPPDRTPELYTRLLPYAIALGLEGAWGEACADALETARLSEEAKATDGMGATLNSGIATALVSGTAEGIHTYEASKASAVGSGGSGGGGGGAGSGGGGGGGGFC